MPPGVSVISHYKPFEIVVMSLMVRTHQARTSRCMYARNAAKMLLDHFVSKMVIYARTHTRVDETAQNFPPPSLWLRWI